MFLWLAATVVGVRASWILVQGECPEQREAVRGMSRGWEGPATILAFEHGPGGRPLLHMELYAVARAFAALQGTGDPVAGQHGAPTAPEAAVAVDCASGRMAVAFAGWTAGMDCSVPEVARIVAEAGNARPLPHLLRQLAAWRQERRCEAWGSRYPTLAALLFWTITIGGAWTVRRCVRRRTPAEAGPAGEDRRRLKEGAAPAGPAAAGQRKRQ